MDKFGCVSTMFKQAWHCIRLAQILDKFGCVSTMLKRLGIVFDLHKFWINLAASQQCSSRIGI
ncbi:MAG: hypothetical protein J6O49_20870, partial [Bacteroidaceae bacterium]|nr:hypothetical protein [Bacteroidaceae bacterium]